MSRVAWWQQWDLVSAGTGASWQRVMNHHHRVWRLQALSYGLVPDVPGRQLLWRDGRGERLYVKPVYTVVPLPDGYR
jgi:hypothetical protein